MEKGILKWKKTFKNLKKRFQINKKSLFKIKSQYIPVDFQKFSVFKTFIMSTMLIKPMVFQRFCLSRTLGVPAAQTLPAHLPPAVLAFLPKHVQLRTCLSW